MICFSPANAMNLSSTLKLLLSDLAIGFLGLWVLLLAHNTQSDVADWGYQVCIMLAPLHHACLSGSQRNHENQCDLHAVSHTLVPEHTWTSV